MRAPLVLALVSALTSAACGSYPTSSVSQGAADGGIWISGAPADAQVRVAGRILGSANSFSDNRHVLSLEPGRHEVEIVSPNGAVIARQIVMLANGAKYEVRVR